MGRPPSTGGPSFRFNSTEVAEMESILQAHNAAMPAREVLEALAQKFSVSAERSGKFVVQMKQVWHWFQNRRYALRAKAAKAPGNLNVSALPRDDSVIATNVPQAPQPIPAPPVTVRNVPQAPQHLPAPAVQGAGRNGADSNSMEFEAKSARDGAWYDVATFLSHRKLETGDSDVLVRFAGFGAEEDEWVNVSKLVRQRSLPCESSECVAVLQGDLILCFQEGKEQALYFDAHVLDAQRRRHDMRGCRCRFLVRYDHDQSEEIVPLRKVCRRPETDYRLQQLHALNESAANQPKAGADPRTANTLRVYPPAEATKKQHKLDEHADVAIVMPAASHTNLPAVTEIKVQQPKVTEIVNAGTLGNSNVQPGNIVMQPKVEIMDAGTLEISNVSAGNVVRQPKVTEMAKTSTLGSSNVPQRNVVQQHEVMEIVNDGNQGNSNLLQGNVVQQQKVTEIVNDGNQGDSNVPPGNTIQQPKVTDIVNADVPGNSHVPPPGNVTQQPEATEIVSSTGILGNANAPPGNVV